MRKRELKNVEWGILIIAVILTIIGLIALFSATQNTEYDEFKKQIVWFIVSLIIMLIFMLVDYDTLVRISPFNAAGKRQTSFVSLDVMPDIEEDLDVEINDDDIRIDTYRSSGAGGQHINKTSSAVRITHMPTGIVVQCQNERSQLQNKDKAMKMLKAKLYMLKKQEEEEKRSGIRGEVKEIGWGNQIRSYVMQPYTMVKDHRTNVEVTDVNKVLDGYIDPFINGYLKWINTGNEES